MLSYIILELKSFYLRYVTIYTAFVNSSAYITLTSGMRRCSVITIAVLKLPKPQE
jgi:hypothetical protein